MFKVIRRNPLLKKQPVRVFCLKHVGVGDVVEECQEMLSDNISLHSSIMSPTPLKNSMKTLSLVASTTEGFFLLPEPVSSQLC
ncbi:hypothetical protein HanLR1_Chr09g0316611 [Helianthus annuus]|nr:hypothetical protein HanHA89_Chr09g0337381 [Helianthus annuus]KAJ0707269.1 hypothetical protein HanLR1_Chr09g0316611 [Helianthus annuus]